MRLGPAFAFGGLLLGLLASTGPAAADDCVVNGGLIRVSVSGLAASGSSCPRQSGDSRLWFPPRGSDEYRALVPLGIAWNVTAANSTLPVSLFCEQEIALDGVRISSPAPVDFSANQGQGTALRPSAGGLVGIDLAGAEQAFASPHSGTASFRLDCREHGGASWTRPYTVLPTPPEGREAGVSIDNGADFTNAPEVKLYLGWSAWTYKSVKVSNDGGFAPTKTREFDVTADPLPWRLVVLGSERLPKTVYVRFQSISGDWEPMTYTDDIVLDTVVPQIQSVTLTQTSASSLASARRTLRVKAKDNRSGVTSIQISKGKPRKKVRIVKYRRALPAPASGRIFVRVRDGAGNWSKWRGVAS